MTKFRKKKLVAFLSEANMLDYYIIDSLRSSSQCIEYKFASKLKITWKEGL